MYQKITKTFPNVLALLLAVALLVSAAPVAWAGAPDSVAAASQQNNQIRFKGVIFGLSVDQQGNGLWIIRENEEVAHGVLVNQSTSRDISQVRPGLWVSVVASVQGDGSLLATSIRLRDHAENEIVVRLKDGVNPESVAAQYGMNVVPTPLLASGNIHLFVTDPVAETKNLVKQVNRNKDVIWAEVNYYTSSPESSPYDTWFWPYDTWFWPYDTWFWPYDTWFWPYDTWFWGDTQAYPYDTWFWPYDTWFWGNMDAAPYDTWFWPYDTWFWPYDTWFWGNVDQATFENQSYFDQINLGQAHASGMTGAGVTVAVLDTGIDPNHPYFAGRLVAGRDFVDDDWDPTDPGSVVASAQRPRASGHGTHISGIILRMAPNSQIMPVRVLDENGRGSSFVIAYAIEWAVAQGADVINLSLGTEYESKVLADVVKYATREGVTIVAAAGNQDVSTPQYPAAFKDVLSVAAVDGGNVKATFSNYGKWVDLSAPGVSIYSAMSAAEGFGFANWSGSSISTAFVSGAAALLQQKYAGFNGNKANRIENDLLRSAGDLRNLNPDYKNELGGLLNVGGAVNR